MAGRAKFKFDGGLQLAAGLKQLGPAIAGKVGDQALRAGAKVIVQDAKDRVPVLSGELRDAIDTRVEKKSRPEDARKIEIGFRPPVSRRAHLTEFGTAHSAAQPFLRPALETKGEDALKAIAGVLERGVDREAKKLKK